MVVERLDEPTNHKRILACSVRPEVHATGFANFARVRSRVAEPAPLLLVRAVPLRVARPTTVEAVTRGNHHPWGEVVGVALAQRRADEANNIGAEGARALSEALKTNTTLQSLNMRSEQEESVEDG